MNREEAQAVLRIHARGLEPNLEGVRRLLERIASHDEAELLRALLVERGAGALLDCGTTPAPWPRLEGGTPTPAPTSTVGAQPGSERSA